MDFIETIFGVSPDGGSGATEALLLAIVIAGICGWGLRRYQRGRSVNAARRTLIG